ncbi:cysteine--tRNA ligase [Proteiniclasticum sp. QWL-01]|uniref:cysteine--tRNA ligase n=1 Tax=Proteiniclasticum sp. QWL-01 TaxID=3036945 RepID=UPI0022088DA4|nr:cysteine--tRNA ligase [Proteiniclasticum sp. QWL-01]UUM11069.1 cysteine--tRNA ligase [Clostridiaceae bacterium HFYG-1003]WFF72399.1 cysteine--tRNA ligase [Proteiniclasticum sp. QWL-01]
MAQQDILAKIIPGKKDYTFSDLKDLIQKQDLKFTIHNTRTRRTEEFVPVKPGQAGLYTCGPTVYKDAHIGNLRTYISEDILKKALLLYGYQVKHVMNITDVGHLTDDADTGDDKMEKSAREMGLDAWLLAKHYFEKFRADFESLNCMDPTLWASAAGHIQDQLDIIQVLEDKGYTYKTSDGIYFDTSKFPQYADFGQLDVDNLQGGARVDLSDEKRSVTDFALWKFSKTGEKRQMEWDSPWGVGFPGWHLECSALSLKYLGDHLDFHAGGTDHIKVHHTNEIAQSESYLGHSWCNYWFHAEFLVLPGNVKMSKSSGNFLTVTTLREEGYDPLDYRYFCLNANYSKQLTFSWESMDAARTAYARLRKRILEIKKTSQGKTGRPDEAYVLKFFTDIFTDLNVSKALGVLWNLLKDESVADEDKLATALLFDELLTLNLNEVKEEKKELPEQVRELIRQRDEARRNKDYAQSDRLRDEITALGFVVKDSKEGTLVE